MNEREVLQQIDNLFVAWRQAMNNVEEHHCEDGTRLAMRDCDARRIDKTLFKILDTITEGD